MNDKILKTDRQHNSSEKSDNARWRRRKDARPEEILETALDCFVESGFAATRLDEIAKRAGVSKGTLYLYFPSKEEIFKAVVRKEIVSQIAGIEKDLTVESVSAVESLKSLFQFVAVIVGSSKISAIPKLVISEAGNFPEVARFYYTEVISRASGIIKSILQRGIKNGEFRKLDVEQTIYSIIAPALFAMLWKHSFEPHVAHKIDAEKLMRNHIEIILFGLKKD